MFRRFGVINVFHKSAIFIPSRFKFIPDKSKVPKVLDQDLQEEFVRGSGPGGQAVAKTNNCVLLRHLPTGIVIRCHETRSLEENRKLARKRLETRLDNFLNGEESVEAQIMREDKRLKEIKDAMKKERLEKKRQLKELVMSSNPALTKNRK